MQGCLRHPYVTRAYGSLAVLRALRITKLHSYHWLRLTPQIDTLLYYQGVRRLSGLLSSTLRSLIYGC